MNHICHKSRFRQTQNQARENPKFTDAQERPLKRYEFVIAHINNQKEQIWTVSKTVCLQILRELRKGFTVMKVIRTGADRSTTYQKQGMQ